MVARAFVEPHLHLDKAYLGTPEQGGTLADAIAETARRKAAFTVADVRARAERVLRRAVAHGTTAVRAHTEVDPGVGMTGVTAIAELAESARSSIRVQLAVFPQEGILCRPGTWDLMTEALRLPDAVVGGCPYTESSAADARAHVDLVLDLAERLGVPADLHLDFADDDGDPRFALAGYLAEAVIGRSLQGRVSIGHATSLGSLSPQALAPVLERLAEARVTVVTLPATDLYLGGRADERNVRRGLAPLRALWAAGVPTAVSSNNIRNAFTPTGDADPLDIGLLLARVGHLSSVAEFERVLAMTRRADVLDPGAPTGVVVGAPADLVLFDTTDAAALLVDQPGRVAVLRAGTVVYAEERSTVWPGWVGRGTE
ncbi:amidohydrolase family protein [Microbacteriaceae bacterium VKM Ac-2854]|nr:amidohydrolase family protein [Microbacteriaceae bacterium VKM Ac-2854]